MKQPSNQQGLYIKVAVKQPSAIEFGDDQFLITHTGYFFCDIFYATNLDKHAGDWLKLVEKRVATTEFCMERRLGVFEGKSRVHDTR